MIVYHHPRCSTCTKALQWLRDKGFDPTCISLLDNPPDAKTLLELQSKSGLPWKRFYNTSGQKYRALPNRDQLETFTPEQHAALLASDGMLIKRPLVVTEQSVLLGFREAAYQQELLS